MGFDPSQRVRPCQPLSVEPVAFEVTLPDSDSSERVEVVGFRPPKNAAFYLLRGRLPLGRGWVMGVMGVPNIHGASSMI